MVEKLEQCAKGEEEDTDIDKDNMDMSLAPLIATQKHSGISFRSLEETLEGKHYLLKCTDGIFSGKFLYINTTPDGEVFGSANPEENEDITMYIEAADLSDRHASIKFQPKI